MKLKKLFTILTVSSLIFANLSAYESSAEITLEGNIFEQAKEKGSKSTFKAFALDSMEDDNGISIDVNSGICGAHFELFYSMTGDAKAEDGWAVSAGNTHLWFKPIDQLRVKIGYVGTDYFLVERVDEERVANPFALDLRGATDGVPEYITNADVDEMGFSLAYSPFENLILSAAIAPGVTKAGIAISEDPTVVSSWGATAEYYWENLIFQASYRDNGTDSWKVARLGVGYEDDAVYAFAQPILGIEYNEETLAYEMNGFALDLYGEVTLIDALTITAHLPLTFRLSGADTDPSYMEFLAMAEYNLGNFGLVENLSPYLLACSNEALSFASDSADTFAMSIQPGVSFNVGACNLDFGFSFDIHGKAETSEVLTVSMPFGISMAF